MELLKIKDFTVNSSFTNKSVGGNIGYRIFETPKVLVEPNIGLGYYYDHKKLAPYAGVSFKF